MTEPPKSSNHKEDAAQSLVVSENGKLKKPAPAITQTQPPGEEGGPKGLEPTRYGDWERKGIVSDF